MQSNVQNRLKSVFLSLLSASERDSDDIYDSLKDDAFFREAAGFVKSRDIRRFYYSTLYPIKQLFAGFLKAELGVASEEVEFAFMNIQFVKLHFESIIVHTEGLSCSADKANFLLKSLIQYFLTGQEIVIDLDGEFTFHLPKKCFKSHDDVIAYFKAIMECYYGNIGPLHLLQTSIKEGVVS